MIIEDTVILNKILKTYEFQTAGELWDYIDYLEKVKVDYELLKENVNSLKRLMDQLY